MQVTQALVIYKKSYYELYGYAQHPPPLAALSEPRRAIIEAMRLSHEENQRTITAVCTALEAIDLPYVCVYRGQLRETHGYDLLLSVGGDGTFLEVAHHALDIPVLGVNSDPQRSTAFFCAANGTNVRPCLEALLSGTLPEIRLARMRVAINDSPLPFYALNDLLFCHANPAAMTSYTLRLAAADEAQKSSGIWISTAAGSTGAIRSAGGRRMPLRSRKLQYLVREPYRPDGCRYQLLKGFITPGTTLHIISKMRRGRLFMDGPHLRFPLGLGDVMSVTNDAMPLRVIGLDSSKRQYF